MAFFPLVFFVSFCSQFQSLSNTPYSTKVVGQGVGAEAASGQGLGAGVASGQWVKDQAIRGQGSEVQATRTQGKDTQSNEAHANKQAEVDLSASLNDWL